MKFKKKQKTSSAIAWPKKSIKTNKMIPIYTRYKRHP